jgi:hypothetical protein
MFREKYRNMNEHICPDQEIVDKIIHSVDKTEGEKNKVKSVFRKPVTVAAMLIVIVLAVTPALAANSTEIYKIMYLVSPTIAQFFVPIQKSCEDNGIKMEVVSAYIHDNTAEIYITMQDLTGDRIDETTDLYDSYSINRPFDSSATCEFVGYNETTKTATFLVSISEWGNKNIIGDKITFSVREFLSDKHKYDKVPIPVDLTNISDNPLTQIVSSYGGSGPNLDINNKVKVLAPSEPMDFPVEGIDFTGIGYVDGMLHIQTSVENNLTKDNHGFFFLKDTSGNEVNYNYSVAFAENAYSDGRIDYNEYVFDIPQSEIGQYSLCGTFWTSNLLTKGNWKVTFPLENK